MTRTTLWLAAGALSTITTIAPAQGRGRLGGGREAQIATTPAERQEQQRRIRVAFEGVVRRQLKLDDQKMRQLRQTQTKFERERRALNVDERQARLALKSAMEDSTNRDQSKIAQSLDQLVSAQRRRADLLGAEQKELATFLTPMQRAQYLSLEERLTRRLLDVPKVSPAARPDSLEF